MSQFYCIHRKLQPTMAVTVKHATTRRQVRSKRASRWRQNLRGELVLGKVISDQDLSHVAEYWHGLFTSRNVVENVRTQRMDIRLPWEEVCESVAQSFAEF